MEEMIKRIIDMDKKAREITDAAQQEKIDCEKEIAQKAAQLRSEYLERARRRIQVNAETERTLARISAPYLSLISCGRTTLPLDFDIFSPFSSTQKPWVRSWL